MTRRRGFSLTEVLVVIGVLVVILGLLFPALGAFRRSGLMTTTAPDWPASTQTRLAPIMAMSPRAPDGLYPEPAMSVAAFSGAWA